MASRPEIDGASTGADGEPEARKPAGAGLCDRCRHQKLVGNTRGSTFSLCLRSRMDERFPRYPRIPVLECAGYERRSTG